MISGKFFAIDDFDVAGHRLLNWKWLDDLPTADAVEGQVIAFVNDKVVWAFATSDGIVSTDWDDITNKPATYSPSSHTHPWDQITSKPTFVNSVTASTGIDITSTSGANIGISNTGVVVAAAGAGISLSTSIGNVTITNTGVRSVIAGDNITVSAATGTDVSIASVTNPSFTHLVVTDDASITDNLLVGGTVQANTLFTPNKVEHVGDPDTYISFGVDKMLVTCGGDVLLSLEEVALGAGISKLGVDGFEVSGANHCTVKHDLTINDDLIVTDNCSVGGTCDATTYTISGSIFTPDDVQVLTAVKTADTDRTNTIVRVADPHLSIALLASAWYEIEAFLLWSVHTTPDSKVEFTGPAGCDLRITYDLDGLPGLTYASGVVTPTIGGVGTPIQVCTSYRGKVHTSSAGNITVDWAQANSSAESCILNEGSWLKLTRLG